MNKKITPILLLVLAIAIGVVYFVARESYENEDSADLSISIPKKIPAGDSQKADAVPSSAFDVVGEVERHWVTRFDFNVEIPDWMVQNWNWGYFNIGNSEWQIWPNVDTADFSGIYFYSEPSREEFNADTQYEYHRANQVPENEGILVLSEIILNFDQNIRIYHLQYKHQAGITDEYYLDNDTETIRATFTSKEAHYEKYGLQVKKFMQGFQKMAYPQG